MADIRKVMQSVNDLNSINCPIGLLPSIGAPVYRTIDSLNEFISEYLKEQQENKPEDEKPDLQIVKEEPADDERETVPEAEEPGTT